MASRFGRAAAIAGGWAAMTARGGAIATHLRAVNPRHFPSLIARIRLAAMCLRDVARGRYRLPWRTVGALTAALAYFVAPIDALPDFIPLTGFIDDAAVLALAFGAAEAELRRYCDWRGIDPDTYFDISSTEPLRKSSGARSTPVS
jgi:uncharacterized membrane protein YkvA (DUF1232 family)